MDQFVILIVMMVSHCVPSSKLTKLYILNRCCLLHINFIHHKAIKKYKWIPVTVAIFAQNDIWIEEFGRMRREQQMEF